MEKPEYAVGFIMTGTENGLRNNGTSNARPCQIRDNKKDQPAEQTHPVEAYQRAANDHAALAA